MDPRLSVKLPLDLSIALRYLAAVEKRSLSEIVRRAIREHLRTQGVRVPGGR